MTAGQRTVAVLGLGSIGSRHLEVLRRIPGVEAIAVPARSRKVGAEATAATLAEAVELGATACVIATNTGRHAEDTHAALELGLDVLVEKPLSVGAAEAHRMRVAADRTGRRLFVGYVLRFSASLGCFRAQLGTLGRLHSVRIECQSFLPDWRPERPYRESYSASATEGGVLRDLSHEIDYAGWLFGWPVELEARVENLGRLGIAGEEAADLMWQRTDGCVVSVRLDYLTRPARRRILAAGENGTLEWDALSMSVTLQGLDQPAAVSTIPQTRDELLTSEDQAFLAATNRAAAAPADSRLATAEDGIRSLAICDAARRASASRRREDVDYLS